MERASAPLMNEKAAAEWLGLSIRWMQEKRVTGGGPRFVRLSPRCVRYRLEDLEAWTAERLRTSTSDTGKAA